MYKGNSRSLRLMSIAVHVWFLFDSLSFAFRLERHVCTVQHSSGSHTGKKTVECGSESSSEPLPFPLIKERDCQHLAAANSNILCARDECIQQLRRLPWQNKVPCILLRPWAEGQPWKGSANDCRTKAKCLTARQGEAGETRLTWSCNRVQYVEWIQGAGNRWPADSG